MGSLTQEQLTDVIAAVQNGTPLPTFMSAVVYQTKYTGKVYSKGRPRFSKGHAFTPATTRKFETAVKAHYKSSSPPLIYHGVHVTVKVIDPKPKRFTMVEKLLAKAGLMHSTSGDVDNKAKSILDAANGVLLADDAQVNSLTIYREYGEAAGFELTMHRSGLSAAEVMNMCAMWGLK